MYINTLKHEPLAYREVTFILSDLQRLEGACVHLVTVLSLSLLFLQAAMFGCLTSSVSAELFCPPGTEKPDDKVNENWAKKVHGALCMNPRGHL